MPSIQSTMPNTSINGLPNYQSVAGAGGQTGFKATLSKCLSSISTPKLKTIITGAAITILAVTGIGVGASSVLGFALLGMAYVATAFFLTRLGPKESGDNPPQQTSVNGQRAQNTPTANGPQTGAASQSQPQSQQQPVRNDGAQPKKPTPETPITTPEPETPEPVPQQQPQPTENEAAEPDEQTFINGLDADAKKFYKELSPAGKNAYKALKNEMDGGVHLSEFLDEHNALIDPNNDEMRKIVEALPEKFWNISTDDLTKIGFDASHPIDLSRYTNLSAVHIRNYELINNLVHFAPKGIRLHIDDSHSPALKKDLLQMQDTMICFQSLPEKFKFTVDEVKTIIDKGNYIYDYAPCDNNRFMDAFFGGKYEDGGNDIRIYTGEGNKRYKCYVDGQRKLIIDEIETINENMTSDQSQSKNDAAKPKTEPVPQPQPNPTENDAAKPKKPTSKPQSQQQPVRNDGAQPKKPTPETPITTSEPTTKPAPQPRGGPKKPTSEPKTEPVPQPPETEPQPQPTENEATEPETPTPETEGGPTPEPEPPETEGGPTPEPETPEPVPQPPETESQPVGDGGARPQPQPISKEEQDFYNGLTSEEQKFFNGLDNDAKKFYKELSPNGRKAYKELKNKEDGSQTPSYIQCKDNLNKDEKRRIVEALPEKFFSIITDELREIGFDESNPIHWRKYTNLKNVRITDPAFAKNLDQLPKLPELHIQPTNGNGNDIKEILLKMQDVDTIWFDYVPKKDAFTVDELKLILDNGNKIAFCNIKDCMTALFGPVQEGSEDEGRICTGADGKKYRCYYVDDESDSLKIEEINENTTSDQSQSKNEATEPELQPQPQPVGNDSAQPKTPQSDPKTEPAPQPEPMTEEEQETPGTEPQSQPNQTENEAAGPQPQPEPMTEEEQTFYNGLDGDAKTLYLSLSPAGRKAYEALKNAEDGDINLSAFLGKHKDLIDPNNGEMHKIVEALPEKFFEISTDDLTKIGFDASHPIDLLRYTNLSSVHIRNYELINNLVHWHKIGPSLIIDDSGSPELKNDLLQIECKCIIFRSWPEKFKFTFDEVKTIIGNESRIFNSTSCDNNSFMDALFGGEYEEGGNDIRIYTGQDNKRYKCYADRYGNLKIEEIENN